MSLIRLIEHKKISAKNPVLIQGLPGLGLVGKIAVQYLVDQYRPPLIASVVSDLLPFPDGSTGVKVVEHDLKPSSYEIYYLSRDEALRDVILLTSGAQPISWGQYSMANKIIEYAKRTDVNLVLSLGGYMPGPSLVDGVFACTNDADLMSQLEGLEVKRLSDGYVTGAAGVMVGLAQVHGIRSACILGTTPGSLPDPKASKRVLHVIDGLVGGHTDFSEMDKMIEKRQELTARLKGLSRDQLVWPEAAKKSETSLPYHM